jgi:hypothetical protein
MNPIWFLRMAKWARNPPSAKRVKLVLVVIAICAAIIAAERIFGFPEWLEPASVRAPNRVITN